MHLQLDHSPLSRGCLALWDGISIYIDQYANGTVNEKENKRQEKNFPNNPIAPTISPYLTITSRYCKYPASSSDWHTHFPYLYQGARQLINDVKLALLQRCINSNSHLYTSLFSRLSTYWNHICNKAVMQLCTTSTVWPVPLRFRKCTTRMVRVTSEKQWTTELTDN